jgi:TM2 domain-containing membrane protein YozV
MAELGAAELMMFQQGMTDQQKMMFMSQYSSEKKDRTTVLVLAVLLGNLGVDRFYLGDSGMGALKLLTLGGCFIWWLVDLFTASTRADDYNRQKAQDIAAAIKASQ